MIYKLIHVHSKETCLDFKDKSVRNNQKISDFDTFKVLTNTV